MAVALAACGSALLLAITNHITQNVASVPFLWVLPLSLYLLSFILCFEGQIWYHRSLYLRLLVVALGGMAYAYSPAYSGLPLIVLLPLFCFGLFVCCMFCHGELARLKPDPSHLTLFYVMLSLGGALGAAFVALVAPRIFSGFYELAVALGGCMVLVHVVHSRNPTGPPTQARSPVVRLAFAAIVAAFLIVLVIVAAVASAVFLVSPVRHKIWSSLKPYQQNRIRSFIDPGSDPLGSGYHAIQSKIAVGSGQLTGKGYRKGTQSQMEFLPERHTDFIFAVIAEELGLIGAGLMVFLYLVLLLIGVETAKNAKDRLGALMAAGIVSMISLYVFINIGMAVGIMPVVGVPLPLVSYGGTSIITTFLALGLLLNIQTRRFMLFY